MMTPFTTTSEQKLQLYSVAINMQRTGLSAEFIAGTIEAASESEGLFDLVMLWAEAADQADRDETLADIAELLDERAERPQRSVEKPKLNFNSLEDVGSRVMAFKQQLRARVDAAGGISRLAELTGMPQPSLSRFFNTASMPRKTTLYRIARALGLEESAIAFDWVA